VEEIETTVEKTIVNENAARDDVAANVEAEAQVHNPL
jgi:hypothetical protein